MKRHVENKHKEHVVNSGNCRCLECGHVFFTIGKLREHLTWNHSIVMNIEKLSFATISDFKEWKYDLEENTSCAYYKPRGSKKMKGSIVDSYKCNRSGKYKNRRVGKRRMKSSGTCKLENNCTSTIRSEIFVDETVEVEVCHTHYGHTVDLEHIKHVIAAKLTQGVTREEILDDIRDEVYWIKKIYQTLKSLTTLRVQAEIVMISKVF